MNSIYNLIVLLSVRSYSTVEWSKYHIHICSKNNFPTAAGLASSAAGFACLVFCLGNLFQIQDQTILSTFARIGSGSACRSLFGGFVQWIKGTDTKSSIAKQLVDSNYWPQMRVLILVVSDQQKDTSSTSGMQLTVKTSALLKHRVESVVSKRVLDMQQAIVNRDFNKFAEITMKDSNQFHAVCQDTWPPIRYMNDVSWIIISLCHKYNDFYGTNKIAYTFDAGPNACLYLLEENVGEVMKLIKTFYPPSNEFEQQFVKGINIIEPNELSSELLDTFENQIIRPGALRYVISTKIGCGPKIVQDENLLNANGFPI